MTALLRTDEIETLQRCANAIRFLTIDAVEQAQSGHPGMPMGMADVVTILYHRHLKFDAAQPLWPDRDRFVLSAGHGSMLLYALNYLTGYKEMTLEQIKNFRQLGSIAAGHPEYHPVAGIETTTGPLGQGLGTAVGMALAERMLASRFGATIVDHHTYVIVGDGCLMEGLSHEAISLAGHLKLNKLIVLFDDNQISIDGPTSLTVSDDQCQRFEASGWHVARIDGHDYHQIDEALTAARHRDQPTFIACRTIIGRGSPNKQGKSAAHGSPLGSAEIDLVRLHYDWKHKPFETPQHIKDYWCQIGQHGQVDYQKWTERFQSLPIEQQALFQTSQQGLIPKDVNNIIDHYIHHVKSVTIHEATRQSSGHVLENLMTSLPSLIGGSADLTGSNNTKTKAVTVVSFDNHYRGQYIHYGVREHAMAAAMNGIALHGGFIPFGGTFLAFSDYCRPAIRMSALMQQRVIYIMTHDSIGLGEDGPTHQPIEHLASLRAIPNLNVFRPADAVEVAECWSLALNDHNHPSILVLSRQALPLLRIESETEHKSAWGAYILSTKLDSQQREHVRLFATGSEVSLAIDVQRALQHHNVGSTVISMPCWELFQKQDENYQQKILSKSPEVLRVGIEAASSMGWHRYLGHDSLFFGLDTFGASAPYQDLYQHYGLSTNNIVQKILNALQKPII